MEREKGSSSKLQLCINSRLFGMLLMAIAGILLTVSNLFVQLAIDANRERIPTLEIVFARSIIQMVILGPFLFANRAQLVINKANFGQLVIMGTSGFLSITFIYLGIERIPLGDATVITFTSPVFTTLFAYALLSESCSVVDGICGFLSFAGVVLAARPNFIFGERGGSVSNTFNKGKAANELKETLHLIGIGYVLLGAVFLSLYYVLTRKIGLKQHFSVNIFYPSLLGSLFVPAIMLSHGDPIMIPECWKSRLYIFLVGVFGLIGLVFLALSLRLEDAGPLILIRNLDIIYAFTLQYCFMKIGPSRWSLAGGAIIMISTSIIIGKRWATWKINKHDKPNRAEEVTSLLESAD